MTLAAQLDNPIWNALIGPLAHLAEGGARARRFPPALTTLAGMAEPAPDSLRSLVELLPRGETAALFLTAPAPPEWPVAQTDRLLQMIASGPGAAAERSVPEIVPLGPDDLEEMLALTALTQPGPFGRRTLEFGGYLGIRRQGRLAAMAGQRLRVPGGTEVSAVCTAPDSRGLGYAHALVDRLGWEIRARRETPFLHVRAHNHRAVGVYAQLGFTVRRELHLAVVAGTA